MNTLTKEQRAYIAGLIDGEGTISITMHTQKTKVGWGEQICHKLAISNTNKVLLQWLVDTTGIGQVKPCFQSRGSGLERFSKAKIKPIFIWALWANGMRQLLPKVTQYLVIKHRHAELMLDSLEQTRKRLGREFAGRGKGYPLSEEAKQRRREIVAEMKQLNQRGILHSSI